MPANEGVSRISTDHSSHLIPARELTRFKLGEERVDIRRWPVFTSDGRLVGAVDRLMVETSSKKIRYIAVALIREAVNDYSAVVPGSVLVPVGALRRLDDLEAIILDELASFQLARAPRLRARPVTRADEDATLAAYGMPTSREIPAADLYKNPNFDEDRIHVAQ